MAAIRILALHRVIRMKQRVFRPRVDFENLSHEEIINRYGIDENTIHIIVDLIQDDNFKNSNRGRPVEPLVQVLVTLRYLAKGDFYSELADSQGISRSTVCRIINRCIAAINKNLINIRFPTDEQEIRRLKLDFYRKSRIPNVISAIDGTLIPIIAPNEDAFAYMCRKGFHALNVQAVVDSNKRFLDVVAKWPGSQHDAAIFDSCGLKEHTCTNEVGCLLGDSGYQLTKYMLTPILNPNGPAEQQYNLAHARGRVVVERSFGVLKSRFRCLHKTGGCLFKAPDKACGVVTACMKLHNLCIDQNIPPPPVLNATINAQDVVLVNDIVNVTGMEVRQNIVQSLQR